MKKLLKINEVEKEIRKRLKTELPNCKFAVRTRSNAFNSTVDIHLMSADFEALARSVDHEFIIQRPLSLNSSCFEDAVREFYFNYDIEFTLEAYRAFKRVARAIQTLNLWDKVYVNLYIGKPDQPFERLERA